MPGQMARGRPGFNAAARPVPLAHRRRRPHLRAMVETAHFRRALGSFATGVAVATCTDAAGGPVGVTVSSFTSVSLKPPLVLFCLDRGAGAHAAFTAARHFAVSVLPAGAETLSHRFAFGPDPWAATRWQPGEGGVPVLDAALAHVECAVERALDGGDHTIFLGRVLRAGARDGTPLLYFRGQYGGFAEPVEA